VLAGMDANIKPEPVSLWVFLDLAIYHQISSCP
jgi:hypothetical protein